MTVHIPKVTRLSSRIIRILGCNPSPMTLKGTNTYLIGTGLRRVLLDAGEKNISEYITLLQKVLKEEDAVIHKIIISHWHEDHIGGVPDVMKFNGNCEVVKLRRIDCPDIPLLNEIPVKFLENGDVIEVEGATLKVYHTPGHTTDHLVLHLKEEEALFSGDCILGEGTTVFEDLFDYMKSLELISNLKPKVIYPGHGPVLEDPVTTINFYINHRLHREKQIFEFVQNNIGKKITPSDVVEEVYKMTPKNLKLAAEFNVTHHLAKLEKEGKIKKENDGWIFKPTNSVL